MPQRAVVLVGAALFLACGAPERRDGAVEQAGAPFAAITREAWQRTATVMLPDTGATAVTTVAGLAVNEQGGVVVFNPRPARILQFDPQGGGVRLIAREGEGPGEVRYASLGVFHDTIIAHDPILRRVSVFAPDGTLLRTFEGPCCVFEQSLFVDAEGRLWLPSRGRQGSGWERRRLNGALLDFIVDPAANTREGARVWTLGGGGRVGAALIVGLRVQIPLQPTTLAWPRPDGQLTLGRTDAYAFAITSMSGTPSGRIQGTARLRELTAAQRDSVLLAALDGPATTLRVSPQSLIGSTVHRGDLPDRWPPWLDGRHDGRGRLWVRLPPSPAHPLELDVFAADGRYLARATAPSPKIFERAAWGRHHLAVAEEAEDGQVVIRVYRLPAL